MLQSISAVTREIYGDRKRMTALARYENKVAYKGTIFGPVWNFLNPVLQIFVYWFVFAVGLRVGAPRGNYPYVVWLIAGIVPWFFLNSGLVSGMSSVVAYHSVLSKLRLPVSIVPIKAVVSALLDHLWFLAALFPIFLLCGWRPTFGVLGIVYFMVCSLAFLAGYSLLTSTIAVLFRDFQKLMISVIRLLFFITPIFWSLENLSPKLTWILKLNPLTYIVTGYRDSLLHRGALLMHWRQGVYFWIFTVCLFALGCSVHMRFRRYFMDLL